MPTTGGQRDRQYEWKPCILVLMRSHSRFSLESFGGGEMWSGKIIVPSSLLTLAPFAFFELPPRNGSEMIEDLEGVMQSEREIADMLIGLEVTRPRVGQVLTRRRKIEDAILSGTETRRLR